MGPSTETIPVPKEPPDEDGFSGINALADNVRQGQYFINVDNEVEDRFLISSAGGVILDVASTYAEEPAPADKMISPAPITTLFQGCKEVKENDEP